MLRSILFSAALCLAAAAAAPQTFPEFRLIPSEIRALELDGNQIGSSGLAGVHTRVLAGDPAKPGYYAILLFVPAHVTIPAHSHRDDRVAVVLSGEWHFGYGDRFDASALKTLPPGSVYAEPGGSRHNHFAQTAADSVIVQISGYGPTDTRYVDPADDPRAKEKKK